MPTTDESNKSPSQAGGAASPMYVSFEAYPCKVVRDGRDRVFERCDPGDPCLEVWAVSKVSPDGMSFLADFKSQDEAESWIDQIERGEETDAFGHGEQLRPFVMLEDGADLIVHTAPSERAFARAMGLPQKTHLITEYREKFEVGQRPGLHRFVGMDECKQYFAKNGIKWSDATIRHHGQEARVREPESVDPLAELARCGDRDRLYRFCEALVDISSAVMDSSRQGAFGEVDSRDLVTRSVEWALEFEHRNRSTDWDAVAEGYIGTVDRFADEAIASIARGTEDVDASKTALLRANLRAVGIGGIDAYEWKGGHNGEPLYKGDPIIGRATGKEAQAFLATIKGHELAVVEVGGGRALQNIQRWAVSFARGEFDGVTPTPWSKTFASLETDVERKAFLQELAKYGLHVEGKSAPSSFQFRAILESIGNPDFDEFYGTNVKSPTLIVQTSSKEELSERARSYIVEHRLGSGNWQSPVVVDAHGHKLFKLAYNGNICALDAERPPVISSATPVPPQVSQPAGKSRKR